MKAAFVIHVRNKARDIADAVNAALSQSHTPLEILLSDQGSTDGTLEIMRDIASRYDGPNSVRILECPHTEYFGHPGMNAHVNWIHEQTDAEFLMMASGDDVSHPDRSARMIRAYLDYSPSMVLTACWNLNEHRDVVGLTGFPTESSFVKTEDIYPKFIGGSSSLGWSRQFWDKFGPLDGTISYDCYFPFLATLDKGAYFIAEPLHCYINHASKENTGLEGQLRAVETTEERLQIEELMHYQVSYALCRVAKKCEDMDLMTDVANNAIFEQILCRVFSWATARERLTMARIPPLAHKV